MGNGGGNATFFKSDKAPIDFEALQEADEPEMVEDKLTTEDDGGSDAVYAKNESAPINFDKAAPVEAKELVEVEGKLPEDDTEKHEAVFEDDHEEVDTDMVEEETEDDSSEEAEKSEEAEYATGESPPIDFTE